MTSPFRRPPVRVMPRGTHGAAKRALYWQTSERQSLLTQSEPWLQVLPAAHGALHSVPPQSTSVSSPSVIESTQRDVQTPPRQTRSPDPTEQSPLVEQLPPSWHPLQIVPPQSTPDSS